MAAYNKDKLDAIENEIESHLRIVAELRTRRNTFVPIALLPNEILSYVFELCSVFMDAYADHTQILDRRFPYKWIVITHVCQHWREVALSSPALWTSIHVGHAVPEVLQTFFGRSRQAPLKIDVYEKQHRLARAALDLIRPHLARTEYLSLRLEDSAYATFATIKPKSLPLLRTLSVHSDGSQSKHPIPLLSSCAFPQLTKLKVKEYKIQWPKLVLPTTLTVLSVRNLDKKKQIALVSDVVSVVQALPNLTRLDLTHVLAPLSGPLPTPAPLQSTLSRLMEIELEATCAACVHFLRHFAYPPVVRVELRFSDASTDRDLISLLASILRPSLDPDVQVSPAYDNSSRSSHQLCFRFDNKRYNYVDIPRSETPIQQVVLPSGDIRHISSSSGKASGISVAVAGVRGNRDAMAFLARLCAQLPLQNVSELEFWKIPYDYAIADAWHPLLSVVTKVQTLKINSHRNPINDGMGFLIKDLTRDQEDHHYPISVVQPPFPSITDIVLENVDLAGYEEHPWKLSLLACIQTGRLMGKPYSAAPDSPAVLHNVTIRRCQHVKRSELNALHGLVEVEWDGLNNYRGEYDSDMESETELVLDRWTDEEVYIEDDDEDEDDDDDDDEDDDDI